MIFHILTAVLVVLKLLGYIDIGWFWVLSPTLAMLVIGCAVMLVTVWITVKRHF